MLLSLRFFLFVVLILLCVFVGRTVFAWGRCDYGQLGIPLVDATRFVSVPTEVKSLLGVNQVIIIIIPVSNIQYLYVRLHFVFI